MRGKLGLVILIVAIVGIVAYFLSTRPVTPTTQPTEVFRNESTTQPIVGNGRYRAYTKNDFEAAKSKRRVLYFHAPWCPICRPIDKEFQEKAGEIPEDVVVFRTDYDTSGDLKKKYGVTYQHTFVEVDAQGNEVTTWNGGGLAEVKARYQ